MKSKAWLAILALLAGMAVTVGAIYILRSAPNTQTAVRIIDYGYSVCTDDIPTSTCGGYEVRVRGSDEQETIYRVAGFSNRDSVLYEELTQKIADAKEHNSQVTLEVNGEGEITAVHL